MKENDQQYHTRTQSSPTDIIIIIKLHCKVTTFFNSPIQVPEFHLREVKSVCCSNLLRALARLLEFMFKMRLLIAVAKPFCSATEQALITYT